MTIATAPASCHLDAYSWVLPLVHDFASRHGVYAIGRLQSLRRLGIVLKNGRTDSLDESAFEGFGVQMFTRDGASAIGSTDDVTEEQVQGVLERTLAVLRGAGERLEGRNTEIFGLAPTVERRIVPVARDVWSYGVENALEKLREHHEALRAGQDGVTVDTSLIAVDEEWRIVRSDGTDVQWNVPRCALIDSFTARRGNRVASASEPTSAADLAVLLDPELHGKHRRLAVKQRELAKALLDARPVAAGSYKLVIDAGLAKGLAHEAFGHAAESDAVRFDSILGEGEKYRTGLQVCKSTISIVDSSVEGDWAYAPFSATGEPRERVAIVDHGVLRSSLADVYSAREVGVSPTGAARCESYGDVPLPRMSNIRIEVDDAIPWDTDYDQVSAEDVHAFLQKHGLISPGEEVLYLSGYRGGQVNPKVGDYVFNCTAIYRLLDGKTTLHEPAIFAGKVLETLSSITAAMGSPRIHRLGRCGKSGQGVPSSGGGPLFTVIAKHPAIVIGGRS